LATPLRAPASRLAGALAWLARATFALYLVLLLGANGQAASGGPLTWWPLLRLPASGGQWPAVGLVALMPVLSAAAWLAARALAGTLHAVVWRPNRLTWPLIALALLAALSLIRQCGGGCPVGDGLRLGLLLGQMAWVYLYVINERPPLLAILVAIIVLQSAVGLGQFLAQHDLGLRFLGEPPLDPPTPGVSVVMRGDERWLRAYGSTTHPNVLAGTLVTALLALAALGRQPTATRRAIVVLAFGIGAAGIFAALSRWATACFVLGLAINAWPILRDSLQQRRWVSGAIDPGAWLALGLVTGLLLAVYGDAVVGRAVGLETPVENRSLWERERDTTIALRLASEQPLTGVGLGQYVPAARRYDAWAEPVHVVPLWLAAELGVAAALAWLWLVLAPLARRGAFDQYAPATALWLSFWLLGLFQPAPHPLLDLRSALLGGLVAGLVGRSLASQAHLPRAVPLGNIDRLGSDMPRRQHGRND
jgi:hypothetical protein